MADPKAGCVFGTFVKLRVCVYLPCRAGKRGQRFRNCKRHGSAPHGPVTSNGTQYGKATSTIVSIVCASVDVVVSWPLNAAAPLRQERVKHIKGTLTVTSVSGLIFKSEAPVGSGQFALVRSACG
jgi:hypothetical protein